MDAKMYALALLIFFASEIMNYADANRMLREINSKMNLMRTDFQRVIDRVSELEKQLNATLLKCVGPAEADRILDCSAPDIANSASIDPATIVPHGQSITVTCKSGFTTHGNPTVTCNNGVFDNYPSCKADCSALDIANAALVHPSTSVHHGQLVTVTCDSGFTIDGLSTVTCNNGVFDNTSPCKADCSARDIANAASFHPATSVHHGQSVTVTCNAGFTVDGNSSITCNNGAFDNSSPCKADCSALDITNAASVQPSTSVHHGQSVIVTCNTGFTLDADSSVTCNNGVFDNSPPCKADCPELNVPNAVMDPATSVSHGSVVTVTCNHGYAVVGNHTYICSNGIFDNVPSCIGPVLTDMKVDTSSSVNVRLKEDKYSPWITGSVFLQDGRLVLCDYSSNKIKLMSNALIVEDSVELQSRPWSISVVNTTTVIVTLPEKSILQYVHVLPRLQKSSVIQLNKECWGIAVMGDEIYTSCHTHKNDGEVRKLNMNGQLQKTFGVLDEHTYVMFSKPYYLTVSPTTKRIYVTDDYTQRVTCLSSDGDIIYEFKDSDLEVPTGVYVDVTDDIIVLGQVSKNLQIITASGKKHKTLLSKSDGIKYPPYSIAYRHSDNTLVVGCWLDDNIVHVFKLVL